MMLNPLHFCLTTDAAWPAFYPLLRPENVAHLVLVDKLCKEQVEKLYADLQLIGQIFWHRLRELESDDCFNDYVAKNEKKPFIVWGIVAAHSNEELQELWNRNVRGKAVTPLPLARSMLAVMQARKMDIAWDWDLPIAATMGNTSIVKVLLEMDVPKEKLCLRRREPPLQWRLAGLLLDGKSFQRHLQKIFNRVDEIAANDVSPRELAKLLLKRPHLVALQLEPAPQVKTPRSKLPTPLAIVDQIFQNSLAAHRFAFCKKPYASLDDEKEPFQPEIAGLILCCPKYAHRMSVTWEQCKFAMNRGETELVRLMLTLSQLATPMDAKRRQEAQLFLAAADGNAEKFRRMLEADKSRSIPVDAKRRQEAQLFLAAADGNTEKFRRMLEADKSRSIPQDVIQAAFRVAIRLGHKSIYEAGREFQLPDKDPIQYHSLEEMLQNAIWELLIHDAKDPSSVVGTIVEFEKERQLSGLEELLRKCFGGDEHSFLLTQRYRGFADSILTAIEEPLIGGLLDRIIDRCLSWLSTPQNETMGDLLIQHLRWITQSGTQRPWSDNSQFYFQAINGVLQSPVYGKKVSLDCLKQVEACVEKAIQEGNHTYSPLLQAIRKVARKLQDAHLAAAARFVPAPENPIFLEQPSTQIDAEEIKPPTKWHARILSVAAAIVHFVANLLISLLKTIFRY